MAPITAASAPRSRGHIDIKPGVVVRASELVPDDVYRASEFYNDWVRPQDDISAGAGGLILKDRDRLFIFGGNMRARDQEKLEDRWAEIVRLIMPHLQQAFAISRALAGRLTHGRLHGVPDPSAVLVLDVDARLLDADENALGMLARQEVLNGQGGRIDFRRPSAVLALRRNLSALKRNEPVNDVFACGHDEAGASFLCRVIRFVPDEHAAPQFRLGLGVARPSLLMTITQQAASDSTARDLALRYHLTNAEIAIAKGIADGLRPAQIAEERGVSIHTVRDQLKTAMTKTGMRRQSELVRLFTIAAHGWQ